MIKFPDTYVSPAATAPAATKAEKSNADDKLAGINQLRRKSIEKIAAALKKRGWDDGYGLTWSVEKTYSDVAAGGFHDIRQRSVTIGLSRNGQFIEASFGFDKIASEMVPEGGAESVFDKIAERLDRAAEAAIYDEERFMGGARATKPKSSAEQTEPKQERAKPRRAAQRASEPREMTEEAAAQPSDQEAQADLFGGLSAGEAQARLDETPKEQPQAATSPAPAATQAEQVREVSAEQGTPSERTRALAIVKAVGRECPFDDIGDLRAAAGQRVRDELGKTLSSIDGLCSGVFTDDVLKALRDGQYEAIQDLAARLPVPVSEEQIGLALAIRAFEGTSHTPEERGRSAVREYVRTMVDAWRLVEAQYEAADEQGKARVLEEFTKLRDGYASRVRAYLASHSQVMSAMIVGPARFPTERNRKRGQAADNKAQEAQEFFTRQLDRVRKALVAPVDNSPQAELQRLKANLAQRERAQELMKAANAALRRGDDQALRDLGHTEAEIEALKRPDFAGRIGYPDFRLRNNNAEIRRLRERVAQAEARVQAAQAGPQQREFAGVRIEENAQDNRLRLYFDGKPSEEVRNDLKANAFKWSPKAGAWQRQLTNNARHSARQILQKHYGTAGAAINEDRHEMAAKQAQQPQADAMLKAQEGEQ